MELLTTKICRVCLRESPNMRSLYSSCNSTAQTPLEILRNCFNLEFSCDTNYPNKICLRCLKQAKEIFNFREQCCKSEQLFQTLIRQMSKKSSSQITESGDKGIQAGVEPQEVLCLSDSDVDSKTSICVNVKKELEVENDKINVNPLAAHEDVSESQKTTFDCVFCCEKFDNMLRFALHLKEHTTDSANASSASTKPVSKPKLEPLKGVKEKIITKSKVRKSSNAFKNFRFQLPDLVTETMAVLDEQGSRKSSNITETNTPLVQNDHSNIVISKAEARPMGTNASEIIKETIDIRKKLVLHKGTKKKLKKQCSVRKKDFFNSNVNSVRMKSLRIRQKEKGK